MLAYVLSIVLVTAITAGGALVIAFQTPHAGGLVILATSALTILTIVPLLIGALTSYWDMRRSAGSRRYFRRVLIVGSVLEAVAVVLIVVYALVSGVAVWVPTVFIGVGAVLLVLSLLVRRILPPEPDSAAEAASWAPVAPAVVRRKVLAIVITFFVTLLVAGAVIGVIVSLGADSDEGIGTVIQFGVQFALLAAVMAAIIVVRPINRQLKSVAGGDLGLVRRISRVVVRGKSEPLDDAEQVVAVKYAMIITLTLRFQLAYLAMLYAALALQQMAALLRGHSSVFTLLLLVMLVVVFIAILPAMIIQLRRVGRYAKEHAGLLDGAAAPVDAAPGHADGASGLTDGASGLTDGASGPE
ncbi:hypothetical protein ACL9RL_13235 [Plantibacter sp. Mn2098]|uniref:hypothetical protein n=1 Tax=Plantibacter sp. Mn2098 TaxID=3395266 RepID=UPI003BC492AA